MASATDPGEASATTHAPELETWLRDFTAHAGSDAVVADFVRQVDERITRQVPVFDGDPVLTEVLHSSTGAQWRAFLAGLGAEHTLALPPAAAELARTLARRGHDLGVLLKVYRDAQHAVFAFFTEVTDTLDESAPPRDAVLKYLWSRAQEWMSDSVEQLIETYYTERERLSEGAAHRRAELVESLLDGTDTDADRATLELGHALSQWQTAVVLWSTRDTSDATSTLLDLGRRVGTALGVGQPLTLLTGTRDLWLWVATPAQPDARSLQSLADALDQAGVRLAAGASAPGLAGFRGSHDEARAAQSVALRAALVPPVVTYPDVELLCLVAGSPELAARMVQREIGPLCAADKNLAQVRETALAYLTSGLNVEATAARLFVHKNTVRYRLSRAEELLGHPLGSRAASVEIALRYVAMFGPPAS